MHDQDRWQFLGRAGRADKVAIDLAVPLRRVVGDFGYLDIGIVGCDLLGKRIVRRQLVEQGDGSDAADGELRITSYNVCYTKLLRP